MIYSLVGTASLLVARGIIGAAAPVLPSLLDQAAIELSIGLTEAIAVKRAHTLYTITKDIVPLMLESDKKAKENVLAPAPAEVKNIELSSIVGESPSTDKPQIKETKKELAISKMGAKIIKNDPSAIFDITRALARGEEAQQNSMMKTSGDRGMELALKAEAFQQKTTVNEMKATLEDLNYKLSGGKDMLHWTKAAHERGLNRAEEAENLRQSAVGLPPHMKAGQGGSLTGTGGEVASFPINAPGSGGHAPPPGSFVTLGMLGQSQNVKTSLLGLGYSLDQKSKLEAMGYDLDADNLAFYNGERALNDTKSHLGPIFGTASSYLGSKAQLLSQLGSRSQLQSWISNKSVLVRVTLD